ncbi:hypothetical protein C4D60_Mb10t07630 [Musa balbisiana]|uniref:Phosphoinositide phospholipase C n=1 Tax=Musa balbisiana TaxID=52838 RepID=A0A4S8IVE1_MUSBA|nr:hypothetical protein C4D60_Mb10t07630 [Musa balbisiana]
MRKAGVRSRPPIGHLVYQDMTAPLSHYFIYTGHNSYLTGNQLSSDCSDVPIIKALQRGVRVIELDLWPNETNNNVDVLHHELNEHYQEEDPEEGDGKPPIEYKRLIAITAKKMQGDLTEALKIDPHKVTRLSLSEQAFEKAASSHGIELIRFTQRNLLRIFPKGTRITSSNYKPLLGWMHGAQMVALNMQGGVGNGSGGNRERGQEGDIPGGGAPGQGVRVGGEGRFRTLLSLRLLPEYGAASGETPEAIREVFEQYSEGGVMREQELRRFMKEVQGEAGAGVNDAIKRSKYLKELQKKGLSVDEFYRYLFSDDNAAHPSSPGGHPRKEAFCDRLLPWRTRPPLPPPLPRRDGPAPHGEGTLRAGQGFPERWTAQWNV